MGHDNDGIELQFLEMMCCQWLFADPMGDRIGSGDLTVGNPDPGFPITVEQRNQQDALPAPRLFEQHGQR